MALVFHLIFIHTYSICVVFLNPRHIVARIAGSDLFCCQNGFALVQIVRETVGNSE